VPQDLLEELDPAILAGQEHEETAAVAVPEAVMVVPVLQVTQEL
jgi:hypothetical protein